MLLTTTLRRVLSDSGSVKRNDGPSRNRSVPDAALCTRGHRSTGDRDPIAEEPLVLSDASEHELWHHLLPVVRTEDVSRNLWWEGLNEAVSEAWSALLHQRNGEQTLWSSPSIQYPAQTALASLFPEADRLGTLASLASGQPWTQHSCESVDLAEALAGSQRVSADRLRRTEEILSEWGWRGDDGPEVSLSFLMEGGRLSASRCNRLNKANSPMLKAVVDALTITLLQDIRRAPAVTAAASSPHLPAHLRRNLQRLLRYVANPGAPLPDG